MSSNNKLKKEKSKLGKMVLLSDSQEEENEHELSYYQNDRVKLMKEVLKIIKPKKIKSMAPDCIKDLDIEEINSMLLEELLGISNKRLKYIFNGQNLDEDSSSSTDPEEEEKEPVIDVISLDDVSEDDFIDLSSDKDDKPKRHKKHSKIKEEPAEKKIKKEKHDKQEKNGSRKASKAKGSKTQEENLMSVLELLELQARARAIRSQLVLEASKRTKDIVEKEMKKDLSDSEDDAVIIESPKNDEIVITSSESDDEPQIENAESRSSDVVEINVSESEKRNKIKLVRDRFSQLDTNDASGSKQSESPEQGSQEKNENSKDKENESNSTEIDKVDETINDKTVVEVSGTPKEVISKTSEADKGHSDTDEIVINVDEDEMDGIIGS